MNNILSDSQASLEELKQRTCRLEFLFEVNEDSYEVFNSVINRVLARYKNKALTTSINQMPRNRIRLDLEGPLKAIDACRNAIEREVCTQFCSRRRVDQASQVLRRASYPILAYIEEELRHFADEVLSDTLGMDWWDYIDEESALVKRVNSVQNSKKNKPNAYKRMLDSSELNHLIELLTMDSKPYQGLEVVTLNNLIDWVGECKSLEELKVKLIEEAQSINLWDEVFEKVIGDKQSWTSLSKVLKERIVPLRHQVMHHQSVRLWQYKNLLESAEQFAIVINAKRLDLEEDEQNEARESAEKIFDQILPNDIIKMFAKNQSDLVLDQSLDILAKQVSNIPYSSALAHAAHTAQSVQANLNYYSKNMPQITRMTELAAQYAPYFKYINQMHAANRYSQQNANASIAKDSPENED